MVHHITLHLEKTAGSGEAAVTFTVSPTSFGGIFYLNMNNALVKVEGWLQLSSAGKGLSYPLLLTFCVTTDKSYEEHKPLYPAGGS